MPIVALPSTNNRAQEAQERLREHILSERREFARLLEEVKTFDPQKGYCEDAHFRLEKAYAALV